MCHPWQQFVSVLWVPRGCLGVESMRHPWQQFVDDFWVPTGSLGCRIHASPVTPLRWLFLSPLGLFGKSNPCVTRYSNLLIISEFLGPVWAIESMRHPWQQFVSVLWVLRGCLGCRIHASPVTAVRRWFQSPYGQFGLSNPCVTRDTTSLIISKSIRGLWHVESMRHPLQQFVDYFWVPRSCLGYRIHASPVTAVR